jgi:SET domain-containing protein 6
MLFQLAKLEEISDVEEAYVIGRPRVGVKLPDAIPTDLRLLLLALTASTETAPSARDIFDLGKQNFTFASADLLSAIIRKRLTDYKTTLGDDDNLLGGLSNDSGALIPPGVHPNRYQMAVRVRKGEKEILQQILQLTQQFITSHTNGKRKHGTDDEQPNKAHKAKK